ncbi:MAG TPA: hypothetical protein VJ914_30065 [Pseudonocardiaceae bacterium]|nr:hypothetical protein [Pseudonocardiaceae bacterium]
MKWFRRRSAAPAESVEDIARARAEQFWVSWSEQLPMISSALGDREPARVENDLCDLVADLHPDLHFALDRGQRAVYALVISGQEDPNLRPFTDAWKAAAPQDDLIWEYHDSVPPVPDPREVTVNLAGHAIRLADVLVVAQVDEAEHVVDVAVYHPELGELDAPAQQALTFLPLDATLGERVAGQRLRRVETALEKPDNAMSLVDFRELVGKLDEPPSSGSTLPP